MSYDTYQVVYVDLVKREKQNVLTRTSDPARLKICQSRNATNLLGEGTC